jgi:raffinose/stachyose/melibiose transport system substrate-binding protein
MIHLGRSLLLAVVLSAGLAACGGTPGENASPTDAKRDTAKALNDEQIRKAGQVTLRMADFETQGTNLALKTLIARFEQKYPNIEIERASKDFVTYGKTIKLTMSSSSAPDIAEANPPMARQLVPAGLVKPLDGYFQKYGWIDRYPESVRQLLRLESNGKTFGSGPTWGVGFGGNLVGVYYNREKLDQLGIPLPRTFDEFEQALATARSRGEVPIQLGNLEGFPGNHILGVLMDVFGESRQVDAWIAGKPGSTYETPGNVKAAETLQRWAQKGYLPKGANGTRNDDGNAAFMKGKGVFLITGTWLQATIDEAMRGKAGFALMPPLKPGGKPASTGWLVNPFVIGARSQHPDLAAAFLDFLFSDQSTPTLFQAGYLPLSEHYPKAPKDSALAGAVDAWEQLLQGGGLTPYLDFATLTMGDTMFPAIQELIGGKISPTQYTAIIQKDWTGYHGGT